MSTNPKTQSSSPLDAGERVRESAYECIYQIVAQDFKLFLDSVGAQKVLSAYQPMGEYSGHAIARNFLNRLELKGDGPDVIAIPLYAFTNNLLNCSCDPVEIRERGVEVRTTSCHMSKVGAPPEFCVAVSHNAGNGIVQEINPEFEIVYTHHLTQDDPYCRYVVKRRSDRIADMSNLGNLLKVSPPIELPEPEKEALTTSYSCSIWMNIIRAMFEILGSEDTIALLDAPSRIKGEEFGEEAKRQLGVEKGDARYAEEVVEALGSALGQEYKRLEDSTDFVRTEIEGCALADGPIEACKQFELLANGVCKSFDPSLEIIYEKMRTKGDKTCHWVIGKKGELLKEKPNGKTPSSGNNERKKALKALAFKYAQGEITKDEYDELKELIQE